MYDTQVVLLCCNIYCYIFVWLYCTGMSDLGLTWGKIGAKWDKSGTFSDQMSVHFGAVRQNVLSSDLKKSRICPIWRQSDPR